MAVLYHVTVGVVNCETLAIIQHHKDDTHFCQNKLSQALIYLSICHNTQKNFSAKFSIPDRHSHEKRF